MSENEELLADFIRILPAFDVYWPSPDNLFREDDGSYTPCGVFAAASTYIRENSGQLSQAQWRNLGHLVVKYFNAGEDMRGVLGACLVENLEFEACSKAFSDHVDPAILRHFHYEGRAW